MSAPGTELCANPSEWPNSCAATAKRLVPESEGNVSNFVCLNRPFVFTHIYFRFRIFLQVFFFFWKEKIRFLLSKLEQTTIFWRGNKIPGKKKIIWILFWKDIELMLYSFSKFIYNLMSKNGMYLLHFREIHKKYIQRK